MRGTARAEENPMNPMKMAVRTACALALIAVLTACGSLPQPRERPPSNSDVSWA